MHPVSLGYLHGRPLKASVRVCLTLTSTELSWAGLAWHAWRTEATRTTSSTERPALQTR